MAKKATSHIHRYEKAVLGKNYKIFKCNLPGCNHYINAKLIKNKVSLCNRCNEPMIMDNFASSLSKPHCITCTKSKGEKSEGLKKLEKLVEAMDFSGKHEE